MGDIFIIVRRGWNCTNKQSESYWYLLVQISRCGQYMS